MITGTTLITRGWPEGPAIGEALRLAREQKTEDEATLLETLDAVRDTPEAYVGDETYGRLAALLVARADPTTRAPIALRDEPVPIARWGEHLVDPSAREQIDWAARLPIARAAALMPDAHYGYGLPIGGVLATEGAVIPYAVGVDIACRMRLSIFHMPPERLDERPEAFKDALIEQTRFGKQRTWKPERRARHEVLDAPEWGALPLLQQLKDKAWAQLGTSGGGNHFVEFGWLDLDEPLDELAPGRYLALLSHSGSRGFGARVADHFTKVARSHHPTLERKVEHLAWLDLEHEDGQAYWLAMELAGRYAAANHAVIHERVAAAIGESAAATIENHHNFAWRETLADGREVIVHRKGATPAGEGVLGIIPGSMGDPGYVVRGRGNPDSLESAAHGAGRQMSRRAATKTVNRKAWRRLLEQRRVTLIGGAIDESPQAYKPINEVMEAQADLVEIIARFRPRIVRMAGAKG